jgi:hypothetical protein
MFVFEHYQTKTSIQVRNISITNEIEHTPKHKVSESRLNNNDDNFGNPDIITSVVNFNSG